MCERVSWIRGVRSVTVEGDVGSSFCYCRRFEYCPGGICTQDSAIERLFDRYHIYLFKPAWLQGANSRETVSCRHCAAASAFRVCSQCSLRNPRMYVWCVLSSLTWLTRRKRRLRGGCSRYGYALARYVCRYRIR